MDFSLKKFGQRQNFIYLCNRKIKSLQHFSIVFARFQYLFFALASGRLAKRKLETNFRKAPKLWSLSSVGSERLPYKQRVGGSNPSATT